MGPSRRRRQRDHEGRSRELEQVPARHHRGIRQHPESPRWTHGPARNVAQWLAAVLPEPSDVPRDHWMTTRRSLAALGMTTIALSLGLSTVAAAQKKRVGMSDMPGMNHDSMPMSMPVPMPK